MGKFEMFEQRGFIVVGMIVKKFCFEELSEWIENIRKFLCGVF